MKCVICHSEDIKEKLVEEEIRKETDFILIPVKVLVCLQCGERYYSRNTMRYLEEFEQKLKSIELIEVGKVKKAVSKI